MTVAKQLSIVGHIAETGDVRQETRDVRHETGNRKHETADVSQDI